MVPAEALDTQARTLRMIGLLAWSSVACSIPIILFGFYPWYLVNIDMPQQGVDPTELLTSFGLTSAQFVHGGWWLLGSGVVFLIASLGLAGLKDWARQVFLLLISGGILFNLLGLIGLTMVDAMMQQFAAEIGDPEFANLASVIVFSGYMVTIVTVVLFAWMIWRLTRDDVVRLFEEAPG